MGVPDESPDIEAGKFPTPAGAARPYLADRRVRYFRSDRLGQPRAKNLGVGLSRGRFVAFLDADDAWLPTKLEKQLSIFQLKPEVGVVFCRRSLIDEAGKPLAASRAAENTPAGRVLGAMFVQNFVCFSSVVVRRQVFEHVGGFDPEWDLSIDYDLWLRAARHTEFDYVDEELVLYRTGHGNLSRRLADRVATADAIMTRALFRRGLADELPRGLIGEGYASTYRALGYTMRQEEPLTAASWYWRAWRSSGRPAGAVRGLAACVLAWARGKRSPTSGENASVNR